MNMMFSSKGASNSHNLVNINPERELYAENTEDGLNFYFTKNDVKAGKDRPRSFCVHL